MDMIIDRKSRSHKTISTLYIARRIRWTRHEERRQGFGEESRGKETTWKTQAQIGRWYWRVSEINQLNKACTGLIWLKERHVSRSYERHNEPNLT